MICYIQPPATDTFALTVALVSFNGSEPVTQSQINANSLAVGIDLGRFSANTDGLTLSKARPGIRLVIDSYLPSDSDTVFGCHGTFDDSSVSNAIVSGSPIRQAG